MLEVALSSAAKDSQALPALQPMSGLDLQALHLERAAAAEQLGEILNSLRGSGFSQSELFDRLTVIEKDLAFKPKTDSPAPDGLTPFSPVNRVVLLDLHSFRMASVFNRLCLSIGVRGQLTGAKRAFAQQKLLAALLSQPRLEASGDLCVMDWNHPFVPAPSRYYEVQLPVRLRQSLAANQPTSKN